MSKTCTLPLLVRPVIIAFLYHIPLTIQVTVRNLWNALDFLLRVMGLMYHQIRQNVLVPAAGGTSMKEQLPVQVKKDEVERLKSFAHALIISKRNDMIQNGRINLSLREQKMVLYMLTKVRPGDSPDTEYTFSAREFAIAIGLRGKAIYNYGELTDMLQHLSNKSWRNINRNGTQMQIVRWFNTVHVEDRSQNSAGTYKIRFHQDMAPYIYSLVEQKVKNNAFFTTYNFECIIRMKHSYSPRIYEILKSYEFNNIQWFFDLQQFKELIADFDEETGEPLIPKHWKNFAVFRRDILEPAKTDINTYTDIRIDYAARKADLYGKPTRSYQTITFFFDRKTKSEQIMTESLIAKELENESCRYEQLSLFDHGLAYEEKKQTFFKERKAARELDEQQKKNDRIEASQNKIFTEEFFQFTDPQLQQLYITALKRIDTSRVRFEDWELWVCDFASHYLDHIQATPELTKTTTFRRLLDSIEKDYHGYAERINELYNRK